jgi:hypothetical protein
MGIGTKVKVNKLIGEVITINDGYALIKFECGQFVFKINTLKIYESNR